MTSGEKKKMQEDEIMKKALEKAFHKALGFSFKSKKTVVLIICGIIVVSISSLHEINESWAWEIAKNLITVNGLILGFSIVGLSIFIRRLSPKTTKSIREAFKDFLKTLLEKMETKEKARKEDIRESFYSTLIPPLLETPVLLYSIIIGTVFLIVSISLSFCLFGVSNTTINEPFFKNLFSLIYGQAVLYLIMGIYLIFRGFFVLSEKAILAEIPQRVKMYTRDIELLVKDLEDLEKPVEDLDKAFEDLKKTLKEKLAETNSNS